MMLFWFWATLLLAVVVGGLVYPLRKVAAGRIKLMVVTGGVLPVMAVGLYLHYGHPELAGLMGGEDALQVRIAQQERRVRHHPADAAAWLELARLHLLGSQHAQAAQAAAHAHQLRDGHPETMATYMYALYRMHARTHVPMGEVLLQRLQKASADPAIALWLAALAALEEEEQPAAQAYWQRWQELGASARPLVGPSVDSRRDIAAAVASPRGAAAAVWTVEIHIAPELADGVADTDTLYVYARDPAGAPMPVAALRTQPAAWPVTVVLDEHTALRPDVQLAQFAEVLVGARLSTSGTAMPQSGDLQAEPVSVSAGGTAPVRLYLTQRIP